MSVDRSKAYLSKHAKERALVYLEDILDSGQMSVGRYTSSLEAWWNTVHNHGVHTMAVGNGTSALQLGMMVMSDTSRMTLHRCHGQEVGGNVWAQERGIALVPVMTVPMVSWACDAAGYEPVFVDVDAQTGLITVETLTKLISSMGKSTRKRLSALVMVHTGGVVTEESRKVIEYARQYGLRVMEDCSHAHACFYPKRPNEDAPIRVGCLGDASAWSLYPTKVFATTEGGLVGFAGERGPRRLEIAQTFGNQGKVRGGDYAYCRGFNFRMSEASAAIAYADATDGSVLEQRHRLADEYRKAGVRLLQDEKSSCYKYTAHATADFTVRDWRTSGVEVQALIDAGCRRDGLDLKCTGDTHRELLVVDNREVRFPGATMFSKTHVNLPWKRHMTEAEVIGVGKVVREMVESGKLVGV